MPIFQRSYEWRIDSVRQLLRDVADRREIAPDLPHFTGTFVLLDEPDHDGVDRLMVIDGQQRLLTLATGVALAENHLKQDGSALVNESVAFASRPRIQPAAVDDADFAAILRGEVPTTGGHLARAAHVITEALAAGDPAEILTGLLDQVQVVRVILDTREDAATVFESLNTTGLPLSQGDLVRTALLAAFGDLDAQRKVDDRYWRPMEARLRDAVPDRKKFERYSPKDRVVDDYLRAYLMRTGQGIESGRLYRTFVDRSFSQQHARTEAESEDALVSLDKLSRAYVGLIPHRATTLNSGVHQRIREIGYGVHFPLMLQLHERAAAGEVELADIEEIAATLEIVLHPPDRRRLAEQISCTGSLTKSASRGRQGAMTCSSTFTRTSHPTHVSGAACLRRRSIVRRGPAPCSSFSASKATSATWNRISIPRRRSSMSCHRRSATTPTARLGRPCSDPNGRPFTSAGCIRWGT